MKSTIEELGPTRVRMAIEVPWGDLDHAFGEVYKELGKQVRVPGFRPGKVPHRVLDQRIGRPVVLEQVVEVPALPVGDLDRDLLVDPDVLGEEDGSESAGAQVRQDLVLPDSLSQEEHEARRV